MNAIPDGSGVAKIPRADSRDPLLDPVAGQVISKSIDPPTVRLDAIQPSVEANLLLNRHGRTVA